MSPFELYFTLGYTHISDISAYDHIVFLLALTVGYSFKDWKPLLWMITAFTVGHSLSLIMATLSLISYNQKVIEFLIPVTILFMSIFNVFFDERNKSKQSLTISYLLTAVFGLIHGMGFSSFLQSTLGKEESLLLPLFSFNIGIEIGQIVIVGILLFLSFVVLRFTALKRREWKIFVSGAAVGISLILMSETVFW